MQVARSHIIVLLRLTFAAHIVAMNFLLRAKSADSTIADSPCTTVTSKIDFFFLRYLEVASSNYEPDGTAPASLCYFVTAVVSARFGAAARYTAQVGMDL